MLISPGLFLFIIGVAVVVEEVIGDATVVVVDVVPFVTEPVEAPTQQTITWVPSNPHCCGNDPRLISSIAAGHCVRNLQTPWPFAPLQVSPVRKKMLKYSEKTKVVNFCIHIFVLLL